MWFYSSLTKLGKIHHKLSTVVLWMMEVGEWSQGWGRKHFLLPTLLYYGFRFEPQTFIAFRLNSHNKKISLWRKTKKLYILFYNLHSMFYNLHFSSIINIFPHQRKIYIITFNSLILFPMWLHYNLMYLLWMHIQVISNFLLLENSVTQTKTLILQTKPNFWIRRYVTGLVRESPSAVPLSNCIENTLEEVWIPNRVYLHE